MWPQQGRAEWPLCVLPRREGEKAVFRRRERGEGSQKRPSPVYGIYGHRGGTPCTHQFVLSAWKWLGWFVDYGEI